MTLSAKVLGIGGAVVLACAVSLPASAMPAAPKSAIVDQADSNIINVRNGGGGRGWNGGGRGWNGGGRWAGPGWRGRPGYRYWNRPGYGWGWWGPGIVGAAVVGAAIAAPYYWNSPGPGRCKVWVDRAGPGGYWAWVPCGY